MKNKEVEEIINNLQKYVEEWRNEYKLLMRWLKEAKETHDPDDVVKALEILKDVYETKRFFKRAGLYLKEDDDAQPGTFENYLKSLEYELKNI